MPQKLSGKEHGLSGSTLKYIAIITMLIDHFGAAFFIVFTSFYAGTACFAQADILYQVMRGIGRTAFPIFCFVLVEGLYHTHDVKRYLFRSDRVRACIVGYISMMWECLCFPAFICIYFYNGKKGNGNKWFFYLFYPVHLLLLYALRIVIR